MTFEKVNQDTPEAQEYNKLVKDLLNNNNRLIGKISSETKQDQTKVVQTINYQEFSYAEMTEEQIRDLVRNKEAVNSTLSNIDIDEDSQLNNISLLSIPDYLIEDIAEDSVQRMHTILHERAARINELVLSDQELREYGSSLTPKGPPEVKIEILDNLSNSYRLKALRQSDPRKETFYKVTCEIAALKSNRK